MITATTTITLLVHTYTCIYKEIQQTRVCNGVFGWCCCFGVSLIATTIAAATTHINTFAATLITIWQHVAFVVVASLNIDFYIFTTLASMTMVTFPHISSMCLPALTYSHISGDSSSCWSSRSNLSLQIVRVLSHRLSQIMVFARHIVSRHVREVQRCCCLHGGGNKMRLKVTLLNCQISICWHIIVTYKWGGWK